MGRLFVILVERRRSRLKFVTHLSASAGVNHTTNHSNLAMLHETYQQLKPELCAYLIKKLRMSSSEAEDMVHGAFEKTLRMSNEQIRKVKNARAFLYKAAYNAAIDHQRHSNVGRRYANDLSHDEHRVADEIDPYRLVSSNQELTVLLKVLKKMPEKRRKLIVMNRLDGLSYAEIARRVQLSETVVRKHVARALADCAQALRLGDTLNSGEVRK